MPSRLELAAVSAAACAGFAGFAVVGVLGAALGACIDGAGLDLERSEGADATTRLEAGAPPADAAPRGPDAASCSQDLATDPHNCGVCGKVCSLLAAVDGGEDAGAGAGTEAGVGTLVAACAASVCTVGCAPGHADCNGNLADGCEVAMLADPRNCGACGVSCGTQACDAGACPYSVLVEDGGTYTEIAVDDAGVFAGLLGAVPGIVELPKTGGVPALLCHGTPSTGLTLDGAGHVVFSDPGASAIEAAPDGIPVEAGAATVLYAGVTSPRELSYGSGALVWVQAYNDGSETPSQSGIFTPGQVPVATSTSFVRDLATTSTAVYFAGQQWIASPPLVPGLAPAEAVYGCAFPTCGAAPGVVAGGQYRVFDVATDGKSLFWTAWGNVSDKAGTLMSCVIAACTPGPLLSGLERPESVVSDGSTVYWYELGLQAIRALPIPAAGADAGAPTTLASGVVGVTNLALDATYIYWDQPALGEIDRARR